MHRKGLLLATAAITVLSGCSSEKVDNASLRKALIEQGLSVGQASCLTDKLSSGLTADEFQKVALAGSGDDMVKLVGEAKAGDLEKWTIECVAPAVATPDTTPPETVAAEVAVDTTAVETTASVAATEAATTVLRSQEDVALNTPTDVGVGWTAAAVGYESDATAAVLAANQFNTPPPPGQRFVTVRLSATFNGRNDAQKAAASELSFYAVGAKGLAYNSYECGASLATPLELFNDVFAGATTEGDICFLVDDADTDSLRVYIETFDANFDKVTTFFALR